MLGLSLSSLKVLLGSGDLCQVRIGKRSLIPDSEIDRFVSERLTAQAVVREAG